MNNKKRCNIALLGATGAVGKTVIQVVNNLQNIKIVALSGWKNTKLLNQLAQTVKPQFISCHINSADKIKSTATILPGLDGMKELVQLDNIDMVFCAISNFAALPIILAAIKAGKNIALANKEILVAAGELIMKEAQKHQVKIIPVDSEHSAIYQCLEGNQQHTIEKLIITGSGGPFLHFTQKEIQQVTIKQALAHPTWKMGQKITIDSATLMNKGLEIIEARWLFNTPLEKIQVLIQPQAIIHSMVEFIDGAIIAQLGLPEMTIPIQYALTHPNRLPSPAERIDFTKLAKLDFLKPDRERFPCLQLAEEALRQGKTMPAVLNASNEIAVKAFLQQKINFEQIPTIVEKTMQQHKNNIENSINGIFEADTWARSTASSYINISTKQTQH
jgi:1-deoxy-D-xylulose-5-phosphate reductoisomerase